MTSGRATQDLPLVVRLGNDATCGCGEHLAVGERVGALVALDRVFCLSCMADIRAGRLDLGAFSQALAAAEHNARVWANAEKLLNRMHAARLLGSLSAAVTDIDPVVVAVQGRQGVEPRA